MDLLLHYLENGVANGYSPHPDFDAVWYLHSNPDVAAANINPLPHYVIWGRAEGRKPVRPDDEVRISELNQKPDHCLRKYDAELHALRASKEIQQTEIKDLKEQVAHIYKIIGGISREPQRLDFVLGELEGLGDLYDELREARKTAQFQSVFDEPSPLVTVIRATAHQPDLLVERCLRSIQQQTYQNLQILVIGDHCVDETAERIARLNDRRIEFYNLPKRGPYPRSVTDRWCVAGTNAANASRRLAKGKFITYLDDDDNYELNRIETLLGAAQEHRAEFLRHKFWYRQPDDTWVLHGNGNLEHGQVGTSMIFYHNFFLKLPWDLHAYRIPEPGDWNRIRKIKYLRLKMFFVDSPLTWYHKNYSEEAFVPQEGEEFLE
jgi:hypothetical protein